MWMILAFVGLSVFLIGLLQWARSGASLWRIRTLRRSERHLDRKERERAEGEIRQLERATDRALRTSFKVLGVLAVLMWAFLGATIVFDLLGLGWTDRVSIRARMFWNEGAHQNTRYNTTERNDILRGMGEKMRK